MEVIKLLNDYGLFRQKCRVKSMGGKTFKQPKILTGVTATFTNEAAAATESNPTFSQIVWTAKKLDVVTGLSQELYDDEEVDIISEFAEITASAMSQKEDAQGFLGSGSPITGAFSAGSINSVVLSGQNLKHNDLGEAYINDDSSKERRMKRSSATLILSGTCTGQY